jgi:hypothetical protein
MPPSFKLSISENYVSACANEVREWKSMRLHDFLGRAGKKNLIESTEARQRAVKETNRWVMRGAAP